MRRTGTPRASREGTVKALRQLEAAASWSGTSTQGEEAPSLRVGWGGGCESGWWGGIGVVFYMGVGRSGKRGQGRGGEGVRECCRCAPAGPLGVEVAPAGPVKVLRGGLAPEEERQRLPLRGGGGRSGRAVRRHATQRRRRRVAAEGSREATAAPRASTSRAFRQNRVKFFTAPTRPSGEEWRRRRRGGWVRELWAGMGVGGWRTLGLVEPHPDVCHNHVRGLGRGLRAPDTRGQPARPRQRSLLNNPAERAAAAAGVQARAAVGRGAPSTPSGCARGGWFGSRPSTPGPRTCHTRRTPPVVAQIVGRGQVSSAAGGRREKAARSCGGRKGPAGEVLSSHVALLPGGFDRVDHVAERRGQRHLRDLGGRGVSGGGGA